MACLARRPAIEPGDVPCIAGGTNGIPHFPGGDPPAVIGVASSPLSLATTSDLPHTLNIGGGGEREAEGFPGGPKNNP